jgi:predicted DNA-binding protein (MmcQ/YjbR family)
MHSESELAAAGERLVEFAVGFPGAWEDHPWGDTVVKVGKKIFVFIGLGDYVGVGVKLPESKEQALLLECCTPTGYGLGKAGWVSVNFRGIDVPPIEVIEDWIEESYRTIAPKKLIAELESTPRP